MFVDYPNRRTNTTRFTCILPDNQTIPLRKDRVNAISDGALILKTNKVSDPMRRMPWNKQGAVLGFEVIIPLQKILSVAVNRPYVGKEN
jgi:hypothetical protein